MGIKGEVSKAKEHKDALGDDGCVHYFTTVMVSQMCTYTKTYQIMQFKYIQFIVYCYLSNTKENRAPALRKLEIRENLETRTFSANNLVL